MATSISLVAEKGGVGRTSATTNLAGWLAAKRDARVLIVDTDPQGSASKFFMGNDAVNRLHLSNTVAALFDEAMPPEPAAMIHEAGFENVYLVPATDHLKECNLPKPQTTGELQFMLRNFVDEVDAEFDFIFIDTPPDIANLPTWSSLLASHYTLTPIVPELFSVQAIAGVDAQMAAAQERNSRLRFLGYFISQKRNRLSLHEQMEQRLRALQRDRVFTAVIPQTIAFAEAQQHRKPVHFHDPESPAAKLIEELGGELLNRIAGIGNLKEAA